MMAGLFAGLALRRGWRAAVTAFGLGVLAVLALPPLHIVPVLWLAIPGLIAMIGGAAHWRAAFWIGLAWGFGFFSAGLYWITSAILVEAARYWWLVPIAVPALALPLGLFVALPSALAWFARAGWARVLVFAGGFVGFELLRGEILTGFPWNLLGTVWAFDALLIQAAAFVGVHGLSLVTLLVAATPLLGRPAQGAGLLVLVFLAAFGWARLWAPDPAAPQVSVMIVQANVAQEVKWREDSRLAILRRYVDTTRSAAQAALRQLPPAHRLLVVWPETAVPFLLPNDDDARRIVADALPPDALLLTGTVRADFTREGYARDLYNSLAVIAPSNEVLGLADKMNLVPFGEFMPFRGWLPIRLVQGSRDFTPAAERQRLAPAWVPPFVALICYEVIFTGRVVPLRRPEWMVNVTNDAWFGITAGPWQHLAAARLRAAEEGLPLVRAAQTGVSAVFDSRGRMIARGTLGEAAVIAAPLPAAREATVFAKAGLAIPLILSALVFILGWITSRVMHQKG
jgi:apolipoprotein N-acyltransferase